MLIFILPVVVLILNVPPLVVSGTLTLPVVAFVIKIFSVIFKKTLFSVDINADL